VAYLQGYIDILLENLLIFLFGDNEYGVDGAKGFKDYIKIKM
jgi:hypothetical protein